MDLEPKSVRDTVDWYLLRRTDLSTQSAEKYAQRLEAFADWCESNNLTNMNDLNGRRLFEYEQFRRMQDVRDTTLNADMCTLSLLIEFGESIEAAAPGLSAKVPMPDVDEDEWVRGTAIEPLVVEKILDHLRKYEYASRRHVTVEILWESGCRLGGLLSLDVEDIDFETLTIKFRHRKSVGTTLKNKSNGERNVNLREQTMAIIRDYLNDKRERVVDKFDRRPLITTENGRPTDTTIRRDLYQITRPCAYSRQSCPHNRDPADCEASLANHASKCPSSEAAHPWRRSSITHQLKQGVPIDIVCDRVDVSRKVLEKHYDVRTQEEKAEVRRKRIGEFMGGFEIAGDALQSSLQGF